jgi:uncharacterized protein
MEKRRKRYLATEIHEVLQKKMVFVGGPRQVGKTTLALNLLGAKATEQHPAYLNWDDPLVPSRLRKGELPDNEPLIILDEIHKYQRWRNLVKGIYDTEKSTRQFIVTGSARLDYYRKGGDSLANRYRYFRLHPFSLLELNADPTHADLDLLLKYGGFPEPLISQNEKELRIWQRDRLSRVVKEDLRDLENVRSISLIEQLVDLLPEKVGSPLSIKSLKDDLEIDHKTVVRWLEMLQNLYVCFLIPPYGAKKIRAVKKEQKLYLWDWSMVPSKGAKFENLVASQLLKYCHFIEDTQGYRMELRFLRDTDRREIDFVVLQNDKAIFAVECKTGEKSIGQPLYYFSERTDIPHFYQIHMGQRSFSRGNITVLPFSKFCSLLSLP